MEKYRFRITGWNMKNFRDKVIDSIKDYVKSMEEITEKRKGDINNQLKANAGIIDVATDESIGRRIVRK